MDIQFIVVVVWKMVDKVRENEIEVDNRWIAVLPIAFENFQSTYKCGVLQSVKSIKYIWKYVDKESDMAVFSLQNPNDEIAHYQMA